MIKAATAKFKAKLSHYLRVVRTGQEVIITDRDHPVARVVPFEASVAPKEQLIVRPRNPNAPRFADIKIRKVSYRGPDPVEMLLEDRRRR